MRQAARGAADAIAAHALSTLCEACWYPVYAFIRRSGKGPHDAEDLTQGFFAQLLRRETFAAADPGKGKPRSFLLTCVRRHLADEHDRAMAQKRRIPKFLRHQICTPLKSTSASGVCGESPQTARESRAPPGRCHPLATSIRSSRS